MGGRAVRAWLRFLWVFLRIGLVGFGGPFALVALLEKAAVHQEKWLTPEEFAESLGIGSLTPGPLASGVVASIGYRLRGATGAALAYLVYHVPSLAMVVALTAFLGQVREMDLAAGALKGIGAAVVGLLAGVAWNQARAHLKSPRAWGLAAVALVIFWLQPAGALLVLLAAAAAGAWLFLPDVTGPQRARAGGRDTAVGVPQGPAGTDGRGPAAPPAGEE
jgi:chromate transporter